MEEWQARVIAERNELALKLNKLRTFLAERPADVKDIDWLGIQESIMSAYLQVLDIRISRFSAPLQPKPEGK